MVRIRAFQARGPGSIPGRRISDAKILYRWACGVMASTVDSESTDPGSNPGRPTATKIFYISCTIGAVGSA